MLTFIGIILLLVGILTLLVKGFFPKEDVWEDRPARFGQGTEKVKIASAGPAPLMWFNLKRSLSVSLVGVLFIMLPLLFFFADRGYNYLLVHPGGKLDAVMEQGIKWRGIAKIDPWQKYIDVKVVGEGVEYDVKELEGVMKPVDLRFIDQVTAQGLVSTRFELPKDKESFIELAVEFRSMSNLVNNTIIPTVKEQLIQTAYMFAAQDYISGEAQAFRQTFEEQLKGGTYKVNKKTFQDTIYSNIEEKGAQRQIREIRTTYQVEKVEQNGMPVRIQHELSENNIIVSQVIVDQLILDPTFKQRLEKQRDESALRQLEQQKIETAKATQQRIIAEGERDKAAERVAQEKEQVKKLIAIETKLKEEQTNKELAQIQLETQTIAAKTVKVNADAAAYEIRQKVHAGITPEKELEMRLDADVKKVAELAKIKFPETMIITGGSEGGTPIESLIGAAMAKQLTSSNTPTK